MKPEEEQRPAIEEFGELIAHAVAEHRGEWSRERDRRLEAVEWAIKEAAEEIRDYWEALDRWELEDGVRKAVATLAQGQRPLEAPFLRTELTAADQRQQLAHVPVRELKEKVEPVLDRLVRLYRIREELQEELKNA
jgi:hypothetical protein